MSRSAARDGYRFVMTTNPPGDDDLENLSDVDQQEDPEVDLELTDPADIAGPWGEGDGRHSDAQEDEIVEAPE